MDLQINEINGVKMVEVVADGIVLSNIDDALDIIGNTGYLDVYKVMVKEEQVTPDFFDLKTKIAGDILQKFAQYGIQLAIVGDFAKFESKALRDFIYESNKQGQIYFVESIEQAWGSKSIE